MSEVTDKRDLATKTARTKAEQLSTTHGVKVHPMVFSTGDGSQWITGFMKEPQRIAKARAMDKTLMGQGFSVGLELLEACLIREESDPRIMSEKSEDDEIVLGACNFATTLIKLSVNHTEKKN